MRTVGQAEPGRLKPVDGWLEQGGRGRQEDRDAVRRVADRFCKPLEPGGIVDVERHIMKPRQEALGDASSKEARWEMLLERLGR